MSECIDFTSPKRKRKVPVTAAKRYTAAKSSISESPFKLFAASGITMDSCVAKDNIVAASSATRSSCEDTHDISHSFTNHYASDCSSSDRPTEAKKYLMAASDSENTKVVHSPVRDNEFATNYLASAFPPICGANDSPFQRVDFSQQSPRRVVMEACHDSSLSSISNNNSAVMNSPPQYLFDSNGTGVDLGFQDEFKMENYNRVMADTGEEGASPHADMLMHSFDDVQSPRVGDISMCTSPLRHPVDKSMRQSPSRCMINISPTILRGVSSTSSPRLPHQFSCVRQLSMGDESRVASPPPSPPPSRVTRSSQPVAPSSVESDKWRGDCTGVARGMSTLHVSHKHDYDSCYGDSTTEDSKLNHKFRKGLAGSPIMSNKEFEDEVGCANGPSPIMSNQTSFMDLLDAASDSPGRKPPQINRTIPTASHYRSISDQAAFNVGSGSFENSPFRLRTRSQNGTPQRASKLREQSRLLTTGLKKPDAIQFDSPLQKKEKSPGMLSMDLRPIPSVVPSPHAGGAEINSPPPPSRLMDMSPPGSYTSVNTCSTEDDGVVYSPPQKFGSGRSILSDFSIPTPAGPEFNRCNSNNSMSSNTSSLPLPDQSAFDQSVIRPRKTNSAGRGAPSPVCPPTPDRSNLYWGSNHVSAISSMDFDDSNNNNSSGCGHDSEDEDEFVLGMGWQESLSQAYPFMRQNSLDTNKVLVEGTVSLDPSDSPDVVFDRDFDNLGVLGAGSFALVFMSRRKSATQSSWTGDNTRLFAVKKNKKKFRGHGDREILLNEVRMMKQAGTTYCPHIVHLIRAWQEDGFFYVQMDIAEKGSVRDLIMNMTDCGKAFPDETIWRLMNDTLQGLKHIHSYNVIHLDIKPANLLISRTGRVMIGDFGLATIVDDDGDSNEGDARYMAPELLNFTDRSTASDIFSFGLSFYEICIVPTPRANLPVQGELWIDMREGRVPSVETEYEPRSQAMRHLLHSCLIPAPKDRATAVQLLQVAEIVHISKLCAAEGSETADPIISGITKVSALPPPPLARSASFIAPPLTRPLSFTHTFHPVNIDTSLAEITRTVSRERSDLTTPTHADSSQQPFMLKMKNNVVPPAVNP